MNCRIVLAVATFSLLVVPGVSPAATVTIERDASHASSANRIDVVLHNDTKRDIFVVGYNSVLEKPDGRTTGNWLHVTDSFGREVPYRGRYVVSGPVSTESFMQVAPGESIRGSVELSREYELPPAGTVTVSTTIATYSTVPALLPTGDTEGATADLVTSNELTFPIVNAPVSVTTARSILQCTASQVSMSNQAIAAAQHASDEAINFLGSLYYVDPIVPIDPENPVTPRIHMKPHRRYSNWFGTWDDGAPQPPDPAALDTDNSRVDQTVMAVYVRLMSNIRTACDECKGYNPLTRAWAEAGLIHLCPSNFRDPISGGITSQAGTIVHEVSHQGDALAPGTVDLPNVRSRSDAHALPRADAVKSAANYEYFITDTPLGR